MRDFFLPDTAKVFISFVTVVAQFKPACSYTDCVDGSGTSYPPGEIVPSHHPCRECVCGAKGNILCESLNRVSECQPPPDAPCRTINDTVCCERGFSCDRLASCYVDGVTYKAGDLVKQGNEKCQECRCSVEGKVRCEAVVSCGRPAWIGEWGGSQCSPVYSGKECCPSDYLCKCTVFNDTTPRAPREVARCTSCSCSKDSGLTGCEPVPCKLPYKFSDKCRAIYRGHDCCPVDYDCPSKDFPRKNVSSLDKSDQSLPVKHHSWTDSTKPSDAARSLTEAALSQQYDVLPYGQSDPTLLVPLGRSDDFDYSSAKTQSFVQKETTPKIDYAAQSKPVPVDQKNMRLISIPSSIGGIRRDLTQNSTHNETVFISIKSGESGPPEVTIVVKNDSLPAPVSIPTPKPTTAQDALMRVFQKVAEKKSGNPSTPTTKSVLSTLSFATENQDVLPYSVPGLLDEKVEVIGNHSREVAKDLGTTTTLGRVTTSDQTTRPGFPSTIIFTTEKGNSQSTTGSLITGTSTPIVTSSGSTSLLPSKFNSLISDSPKSADSAKNDIVSISISTGNSHSSLDNKTDVSSGSSYWKTPGNFHRGALSTSFNSSRFSSDPNYSMSSADAGFLADDLSYKLFSVNFFRVPLGETSTMRMPKALLLADTGSLPFITLNSTVNTSSTFIALQGQPVINSSSVNITNLEFEPLAAADSGLVNVTVPPDFQVVTFGSVPRQNRPKSAGQLLPPMIPGVGGPGAPILPFTTEIEFKGFGMIPEIEIKPLDGLAGLAGMAAMMGGGGGGGGGGGPALGGQLAGGPPQPGPPPPQGIASGIGNGANRMAAAMAAQDAMEELAEGGTGDGALALAAALMHNPHRPVPARLVESTRIGHITTPAPTVAIIFPNGSTQVGPARSGPGSNPNKIGKMTALETSQAVNRLAEFNAMFGQSPNHHYNFPPNPWANPIYTGAGSNPQPTTTTDRTTVPPKESAFPFEAMVDVLEEGRGPQLTQLLGALQFLGRPQAAGPFGMMQPQTRSSFGGMNMMNMNQRSNYFPSFQSNAGFGLEGMGGMGGMGGMSGMGGMGGMGMGMHNPLFSLFAGSLMEPQSAPAPGRPAARQGVPANYQQNGHQPQQRRLNPGINVGTENTGPLRPMYKVSSGMTESPLEGAGAAPAMSAPLIAAMFER